jgi:hypothetical protein
VICAWISGRREVSCHPPTQRVPRQYLRHPGRRHFPPRLHGASLKQNPLAASSASMIARASARLRSI